MKQFKTLADLMIAFQEPQAAIDHFTAIRWRNGQFCPHCGHGKVYKLTDPNRYKCAECHTHFSILVGTIFENTKLPLRVWFGAIWLLTNHPKGIASTTLAKDLGITQKSAWFMLHRLRHAARTQSFNKPLNGIVEVDETFVGGKARNKHIDKRGKSGKTGGADKAVVVGAVEREGDVVARVVENVRADTLTGFIRETVSPAADLVVTDQWVGYKHLGKEYPHAVINHAQGEYVDGDGNIHTQTIESVWALLKRQIIGVHHWVSPKHLQQYVAEMTWRMNRREMSADERVNALFSAVEGRLTYQALIV